MSEDYDKVLKDFLTDLQKQSKHNPVMKYINLLTEISDAPVEFHLIAALWLLSIVTPNRFAFASSVDSPLFSTKGEDGIEGRQLLLWIIALGKSRISRKTSAMMKKIDEVIVELGINAVTKIFSAPHLRTQLSSMVKDNSVHAVWVLDECSLFFSLLASTNSYLMDAESILSLLYDGKSLSSGTQSRGTEYVPNPNFGIFLCSTESLPSKFKDDAFEQGFYNRFIFVPARRKERKDLKPRLTDEQLRRAQEFLEDLRNIRRVNHFIYIFLDPDASEKYKEFEIEIENKIDYNDLGIKEGYYGGVPNFVIRVACLLRINRITKGELESGKYEKGEFCLVEGRDINLALKFGKLILMWFENMMDLRAKHSKKASDVITEEKVEGAILGVFKEAGKRKLPQNYIRKKSKIKTKVMEEALEGFAESYFAESSGGKRPKMWRLDEGVEL